MLRAVARSLGRRIIAAWLLPAVLAAFALAPAPANANSILQEADLESIGDIVRAEIQANRIPGAVVEIGQGDRIVYRRAFGDRVLEPRRVAMTPDTIFDLASLTKVIATTVAIMQLRERGKLDLDAPAAKYWPRFGQGGKERVTVRELMTHYSGLAPDMDLSRNWSGSGAARKLIAGQKLLYAPGARFVYSDINFEVLGEIVRRVSGRPLDAYCRTHIFRPLGMTDTGFKPSAAKRSRIAPTAGAGGRMRIGEVHDPTAARMGGVAGSAGLFSTADDLSIFARMMLDGGRARGVRILSPKSIDEMTIPQSPPALAPARGLGWDLAAPLASNRDELLPAGSYGHTGFTGTMIWIDPVSKIYVIVLTNRTYPHEAGDAGPLRKQVLTLVSNRVGLASENSVIAARPSLTAYCELTTARGHRPAVAGVATGADVLAAENWAELNGRRVGLITNQTGITQAGVRDIDAMRGAPTLKLAAIFSPEHGLYGDADGKVASGMEPISLVPLYSLYGDVKRPTAEMLAGIDALVFDVQDAGARFYTYIATMAYAMEAAAQKGIDFYVLDRPNPIGADIVQGPMLDPDLESFTGYFPMPVRHGMTMGELATMFNAENRIGARLHVIRMQGYERGDWYDDTRLRWVNPSPNLRSVGEAALYPGIAMLEGANVSVGRGTASPFELVGAPWADGARVAAYLKERNINGVSFEAADFTPSEDRFANENCHGMRIILTDRRVLDSPELGIEIASALHRLYPDRFELDRTLYLIGSRKVLQEIRDGEDPRRIAANWQDEVQDFIRLRSRYLLY